MAFISRSCAACATDSQIVSEMESCRCWRRLCIGSSLADSASSTIFAIIATVSRGYLPLAVSAESITASEPSRIALATSLASARVGRGFSIIDSNICVAVITGLRQSAARHHHSVRDIENLFQVCRIDGLRLLQFGDDPGVRVVHAHQAPYQAHVIGRTDKRNSHNVYAMLQAELQVFFVLLRQRRHA